ncbi:unnamed protein product [Orchesella dallaii]|uniref:Single domain-containing protein n=1 Tax=Orchesella dallaii TaxID=48710 RepID=A0ABP1Q9R0_9HEXA
MYQSGLDSFYGQILIALLCIICNFENVKSNNLTLVTDCNAVRCYSPSDNFNCTVSRSINPKFLKRIGPLKDCCPTWCCTDKNKTRVLFMGMKENDKQHSIGNSSSKGSSKICNDVHCPKLASSSMSCQVEDKPDKTFQLLFKDYKHCCPTMYFVSSGNVPTGLEEVIMEKGISSPGKICSKISCAVKPSEVAPENCKEVPVRDVLTPKAINVLSGFLECCPTAWQCKDPDGSQYSVYDFIEGTLPESGKGKDSNCDDFLCGPKPNYENTICWVTQDNSSKSIASSLGNVRDCCPVWKCAHSDGTFYNKYRIMSKGFVYKEIQSAQKEVEISQCKLEHDADKGQKDKSATILAKAREDTGDSSIKTDKNNENILKEKGDAYSGHLFNGDGLRESSTGVRTAGSQNRTDSDNGSSLTMNNKAVTEMSDGSSKSGDSDGMKENRGAKINETDESDKGHKENYEFDPGQCDPTACLKPEDVGQCQQNLNYIAAVPKPFLNCCPSYTCFDSSKGMHMHYSTMLWGKIPLPTETATSGGTTMNNIATGICSTVQCDQRTIEKDAICSNLVEGKSSTRRVLGDYHVCCDMLNCVLPDGTTIYHYGKFLKKSIRLAGGMMSRSFRYMEIRRYASILASNSSEITLGNSDSNSRENSLVNTALNSSDNRMMNTDFNITSYTNDSVDVNGKRVCTQEEICPRPKINGTCYEETTLEAMSYVPGKESCCPLIHCISTDSNGPHYTQFVKYSGTFPTTSNDIEIQKGVSVNGTKCPKITCTSKPSFDSVSCTPIAEGHPTMPQVKPFVDCCGMLRCNRQDGSSFIEFRVAAASFVYHETSFFNIKQWHSSSFYNQYKNYEQGSSWSQSTFHNNMQQNQWASFGMNHGMPNVPQPPLMYQHPRITVPAVQPFGMPYMQPMQYHYPTGNGLHQQIVNNVNHQLANPNMMPPVPIG